MLIFVCLFWIFWTLCYTFCFFVSTCFYNFVLTTHAHLTTIFDVGLCQPVVPCMLVGGWCLIVLWWDSLPVFCSWRHFGRITSFSSDVALSFFHWYDLLQQNWLKVNKLCSLIPGSTSISQCSLCSWDAENHTWEVTEALRPSIITIDWQQKNRTVFKSVNFAGYIGIVTAIKPVSICNHSLYDSLCDRSDMNISW